MIGMTADQAIAIERRETAREAVHLIADCRPEEAKQRIASGWTRQLRLAGLERTVAEECSDG